MRYQQAVFILGRLFYWTSETAYHFVRNNESEVLKYTVEIGNSEEYLNRCTEHYLIR
jgi:thymidine kinase